MNVPGAIRNKHKVPIFERIIGIVEIKYTVGTKSRIVGIGDVDRIDGVSWIEKASQRIPASSPTLKIYNKVIDDSPFHKKGKCRICSRII